MIVNLSRTFYKSIQFMFNSTFSLSCCSNRTRAAFFKFKKHTILYRIFYQHLFSVMFSFLLSTSIQRVRCNSQCTQLFFYSVIHQKVPVREVHPRPSKIQSNGFPCIMLQDIKCQIFTVTVCVFWYRTIFSSFSYLVVAHRRYRATQIFSIAFRSDSDKLFDSLLLLTLNQYI